MQRKTSADLSHVSTGTTAHPVRASQNPAIITDLQRRLMAGKAGLLELALLRESHRRLVEGAKKALEDQSRIGEDQSRRTKDQSKRGEDQSRRTKDQSRIGEDQSRRTKDQSRIGEDQSRRTKDQSRKREDQSRRTKDQSTRASKTEVNRRVSRSRRWVSESYDGAPEYSSSDDEEEKEASADGDSSSVDEVFYTNPILSKSRISDTASSRTSSILATAPRGIISSFFSHTKPRRMSEFQYRGLDRSGKPSFCRTFNGIRLPAHRRRSEGISLKVRQAHCNVTLLTDSYRKPVAVSGLIFNFPSPLHAVLSQFDLARVTPSTVPIGGVSPCLLKGEDGFISTVRQGRGTGPQKNGPVRRLGRFTRGSDRTLLFHQSSKEKHFSVSDDNYLLYPQRERVRLEKADSVHPQRHRQGHELFSRTVDQEDLGEVLTTVPADDSNAVDRSSEENSKGQDPELERCSSEEKDPEDQIGGWFEPSKEAVARPRLSRTALFRLSEEGYFSGSDTQPSFGPDPPPRKREKSESKSSSPKQSNHKESSTTNSDENLSELNPQNGSGPCTVQSETGIEALPSQRLPIFC